MKKATATFISHAITFALGRATEPLVKMQLLTFPTRPNKYARLLGIWFLRMSFDGWPCMHNHMAALPESCVVLSFSFSLVHLMENFNNAWIANTEQQHSWPKHFNTNYLLQVPCSRLAGGLTRWQWEEWTMEITARFKKKCFRVGKAWNYCSARIFEWPLLHTPIEVSRGRYSSSMPGLLVNN